jgi:hypothetical protein
MRDFNNVRTYGDLIQTIKPNSLRGNCCACHKWDKPTWQLSTRASICEDCCRRKADKVLGSILKAERRARHWIKNHESVREDPQFVSRLTGASLEFVKAEIAKAVQS